jgi:hypothetical protein
LNQSEQIKALKQKKSKKGKKAIKVQGFIEQEHGKVRMMNHDNLMRMKKAATGMGESSDLKSMISK